MRVLQIGAGRWGRNHARSWREIGVELVVCDRDPARLHGIDAETTTDPKAALERVDAVDIATPAPSHAELVRTALDAGRDVLVEKPFATESGEAFALAALARERGAVLQVGHVFRFAPEARALARLVRDGTIGEVRTLSGHFSAFKRPRSDGGVALSDALHWVDLFAWLTGARPRAVTATLRDLLGRGLDDLALLGIEFGDVFCRIEASCFEPVQRREITVVGSTGAASCDFLGGGVAVFANVHREQPDGSWQAEPGPRERVASEGPPPLLAELDAFRAACASRRLAPEAATGTDGAVAVAVIEAAARSSAEGRRCAPRLPDSAAVAA